MRHLYSCREEGTGRALPLILRPEQSLLVDHMVTRPTVPIYVIKSRRLGISTCIDTFQADCGVFSSGFRGSIVDQTQADATKKMVEIVRFAVDNLDPAFTSRFQFDKRNDSELRLRLQGKAESTDSVIYATTGGRGGDCSMLHVSEWGPIAALDPVRSLEIRSGAFPAARKGRRVVETTWYGGKSGELWDLVKPIMDGDPNAEGQIYFFPWHADPQAIRIDGMVTKEIEEYFRLLAEKVSRTFTQEQKKWYASKKLEQGMWVKREYPSTLDEALSVPMAGTIYGDLIDTLREQKQIRPFPSDPNTPAYTFWDIGLSDFGCLWLVQFVGRDILVLDYVTAQGEPAAFYADATRAWERKHVVVVRKHYLPHDANKRAIGTARTFVDDLVTAGLTMREIAVVPRTPDVWLGINAVRGLIPRMFIHALNCCAQVVSVGSTIPSGLDCLEYYHRKVEVGHGGVITEDPVHDQYSHGADALRTLGEAYRQGLIEGGSAISKQSAHAIGKPKVLRGPGEGAYPSRQKWSGSVRR